MLSLEFIAVPIQWQHLLVIKPFFAPSLLPVSFEDEEMERAWALDLVLLPQAPVWMMSSVTVCFHVN